MMRAVSVERHIDFAGIQSCERVVDPAHVHVCVVLTHERVTRGGKPLVGEQPCKAQPHNWVVVEIGNQRIHLSDDSACTCQHNQSVLGQIGRAGLDQLTPATLFELTNRTRQRRLRHS